LEPYYKKLIGDFSFLSVREQDGANIISALIDVKPEVVADPTLLLTSNDWTQLIMSDESSNYGMYILCYFLGNNNFYLEYVKQLKEKYNLKIITIKLSYTLFCYGDIVLYNRLV
jgi:CO dehydrogenase/acetyl-CoA synthase epsilon subunit